MVFHKHPKLVIKGTFDKNGLHEDWPEFAENVFNFICFYGIGEIYDPALYMKACRKADDCIFCSVKFDEYGKSYYYLAENDTFSVSDSVLVPVGLDNRNSIAVVAGIDYFPADKTPFPLDKVKKIIRKCNDDDLKANNETTE